mgnify:CR=1 FL=1
MLIVVAAITAGVILSLSYFFFLLALSVFLAYLLVPVVRTIRSPFRGTRAEPAMPRWLAIVIAYVLVFSIAGVFIAYITPPVVEQGKEFGANLPAYADGFRRSYNDLNRRFDRLRMPEEVQTALNDQAVVFGQYITSAFGSFLINTVTYLPLLIIVPFLTFFFLKDAELIRLAILKLFPPGRLRERADAVVRDVNTTIAAYTRAQLISCLLIGVICTIGFNMIGLRYALLLGILAGIFEFVPLLGPLTIGAIATSVGTFGENPRRGLYTLLFLIALRIFHDYVTYPRIVGGGIRLHPLLIILSVIAGEQIDVERRPAVRHRLKFDYGATAQDPAAIRDWINERVGARYQRVAAVTPLLAQLIARVADLPVESWVDTVRALEPAAHGAHGGV